jgi:serine/threonine protein kinase
MEISHIPRRYTSSPATITSTVSGPLAFIKLALEELKVPFVYFKRGLKVGAGTGASFTVQHFDINDTNMINHLRAVHRADYFPLEEPDTNQHANGNETYLQILPSSFKKDQWLIAKHIAPINKQERDMIELDENHSSAIRLASISLEMRILAHEPLRKHPNIVDILAFTWEKIPDELSRRWPILVMEDADCGTLADMNEFGVSPLAHLQNALGIACDAASGLAAIHACGVVHSDLKFENILIFEQPDGSLLAKISDFGLSLVVPDLEASGVDLSTGVQLPGFTRPWEAPESYNTIPLANIFKVDVFAFGLLFSRLMAKGQDIFARYHNQYAVEVNDLDNCYDFEGIFDLKQGDKSMIDHAHQFIKSHNDLSESELQPLLRVAELTLHTDPELRSSMEDLVDLVCTCAHREPIICDE